jgi:hypothetical protein
MKLGFVVGRGEEKEGINLIVLEWRNDMHLSL